MKKLVILTGCCLFLTGCADTTELGSRAIIQSAGIDYADGVYRVSALMFSSSGSGGTIDASQENVIKVCGEGTTLTEAIDNVSLNDGKEIYMSETKLLILGKGFDEISVTETLDILFREMRCGLNMPICCADNAEELTEIHFTEGMTASEKPLSIIENSDRAGRAPKTLLLDVLADSEGERDVLIPHFALTENGSSVTTDDSGITAVIDGTYLVSGGRLKNFRDETETIGLMLIGGKKDSITLNYLYDGSERTCIAYDVKVRAESGGIMISSKFRKRNGGRLSGRERQTAYENLCAIIESVL